MQKPRFFFPFMQIALGSVLLLSLSGCASSRGKKQYAGVSDSDMISGTPLPERQEGISFTSAGVDRRAFAPVHFGFDSSEVLAQDVGRLDEVAASVRESGRQLILAGFTDERGTAEYNRGLGERRAQTVRMHLLQRGVRSACVQTTSFGAEMPTDGGHGEAAWARNRRVEFGVTP